jgi:hypothetical protein
MRAVSRNQTGWDRDRAKMLYDQGLSYAAIGRDVGCTPCAISGYANRNDWGRVVNPRYAANASNFHAEPRPPGPPPARILRPGEPTLPPLMSLTYGD